MVWLCQWAKRAGITRLSVIELAKEWGECDVIEKRIPCREIIAALDEGRMLEMFGTGTAAVLQPVGGLRYKGRDLNCPADGYAPGSLQVSSLALPSGSNKCCIRHPRPSYS